MIVNCLFCQDIPVTSTVKVTKEIFCGVTISREFPNVKNLFTSSFPGPVPHVHTRVHNHKSVPTYRYKNTNSDVQSYT